MSQQSPREWATLCLFLTQEILLLSATPGKTAKDQMLTHVQTLREACLAWITYLNYSEADLMAEVWKTHPGSLGQAKVKAAQGKRKKS